MYKQPTLTKWWNLCKILFFVQILYSYFRCTYRLFLGCLFFVTWCNIMRASWETKKERLSNRKKVHRTNCVKGITFLTAWPPFYIIFCCFFVYSLSLIKWLSCWMAPKKIHDIALCRILCDDIVSLRSKIWKALSI